MKIDLSSFGGGVVAALLVVAIVGMVFCMTGCNSGNSYAGCKQSVIATDAAVQTTSTLLSAGTINKTDARAVSVTAHTLQAAEISWLSALKSGDTNGITTGSAAVQSALTTLNQQLIGIQQTKQLPLNPQAGRQRLSLNALGGGLGASDKKSVGEVTAAIEIIQLVADLTPQVVAWINAASAKDTVTADDVQAVLDVLTRDLATLDAAIGT